MKTSQKSKKLKTSKIFKKTRSRQRTKRKKSKSKVRIPITTKGGLFEYHVNLPEKKRRSLLKFLLSRKKASYSEIIKRLNVLSIYNKRRHPETTRKVNRDMDFLHKHYQKYSLTFQHRSPKSKRKSKPKSKMKSKPKSKRKSKRKSKPKSKKKSKRKSKRKSKPKSKRKSKPKSKKKSKKKSKRKSKRKSKLKSKKKLKRKSS